jgi:peptidoglycan/xylan/chitin deacetylase (PgdA/CDA1 family)
MKHKLFLKILLPIVVIIMVSSFYLPRSIAATDPVQAKTTSLLDMLKSLTDTGQTEITDTLNMLKSLIDPDQNEITDTLDNLKSYFNPKLIFRGHVGPDKLVALTIDDGPDARFTPQVLNILNKYHIKATFFVVGESINKNPNLLIREIREGNEIENHTYTHPDLRVDSLARTEEEILRNQALIEKYTFKRPLYFRPPKGLLGGMTTDLCDANGYKVVLWSICVEHAACKTPQAMAARVIRAASPGTIILAHDGRLDRSSTMAALPLIIDGYQKKGYHFVTLNELLNLKDKNGGNLAQVG